MAETVSKTGGLAYKHHNQADNEEHIKTIPYMFHYRLKTLFPMLQKTVFRLAKYNLSVRNKQSPTDRNTVYGHTVLPIWEVGRNLIEHKIKLQGRKKNGKSTCRRTENVIFAPTRPILTFG